VRYVGPVHVDLGRTERRRNRFFPQELRFFPTRMTPSLLRSVLHLYATDAVQSEALAGSLREKLACISLSEKISQRTACLDMNNDE